MSEQSRTDQRSSIGRRESDFEVVALRLQHQEQARVMSELRVRVHKLELDVIELQVALSGEMRAVIEREIRVILEGLL